MLSEIIIYGYFRLDSCLSDIMKQSNRMSGGKSFSSPRDALQYMADHHTLEKTTCYDPDLDDVMKFLSHVVRRILLQLILCGTCFYF